MKKSTTWLYQLSWMFPSLFFILIFALYPIWVVLSNGTNQRPNSGVYEFGFYQFKQIFSDPNFTNGLATTAIYAVIAVPLTLIISILIAKGISKLVRPRFFQSVFFMPYLTSSIAVGMIFQILFQPQTLDSATTKIVLIIFGVFQAIPFRVIMFISAFKAIDQTLYKAAASDGVPNWQMFFKIDLPNIMPVLLYNLTTGIINGFKFLPFGLFISYDQAVSKGGQTVVYYVYAMINEKRNYGQAAAASVILAIFIIILTGTNRLVWNKYGKQSSYAKEKAKLAKQTKRKERVEQKSQIKTDHHKVNKKDRNYQREV